MSDKRGADTDRFYELLDQLSGQLGGPRRLKDSDSHGYWPSHGVYFFFEDGEIRANGQLRVTRVGTHALRPTSQATLWHRLRQHRGRVNGRNPGGGNHRASIFRGHVGSALIRRDNRGDDLLETWAGRHRQPSRTAAENEIERDVSNHIGNMPLLWLPAPNSPSGDNYRGYLERQSIALLSCRAGGIDRPSRSWLGCYARSEKVRASGLWNSDHVDEQYDPAFLETMARLVQAV